MRTAANALLLPLALRDGLAAAIPGFAESSGGGAAAAGGAVAAGGVAAKLSSVGIAKLGLTVAALTIGGTVVREVTLDSDPPRSSAPAAADQLPALVVEPSRPRFGPVRNVRGKQSGLSLASAVKDEARSRSREDETEEMSDDARTSPARSEVEPDDSGEREGGEAPDGSEPDDAGD